MIEYTLGLIMVLIGLPVVCYLCAKMCAYGTLMGKYRFKQDHVKEEMSDGYEETESKERGKGS